MLVRDYGQYSNGEKLVCDACEIVPVDKYGGAGERSMEALFKVPIEELQSDRISLAGYMEMVGAMCHSVIHSS